MAGGSERWGPFAYGYSMTIGPEGKPIIRELGNVHLGRRGPMIKEELEPLTDVVSTDDEVTVIAELPGVDKEEIKLHALERKLTISVDTRGRKYYKEVNLGEDIEPNEAKTSYENGVLKVTFRKAMKRKPKGEPIKLE
ncbi:MAG: Hsp20/alpha crystallin family protein [Candidatus Bathyarchaeota archaeon]|jgi:HSP20 family protein|nr:Hsp20/alpha crystallin family protein [Candidatus Bathyarchaeota archaeon]